MNHFVISVIERQYDHGCSDDKNLKQGQLDLLKTLQDKKKTHLR